MCLPLLCPFYLFCFDCSGCTTSSATDHWREIPPFLLDHDHAFGTFSKYCIYPHSIWGAISLQGIPGRRSPAQRNSKSQTFKTTKTQVNPQHTVTPIHTDHQKYHPKHKIIEHLPRQPKPHRPRPKPPKYPYTVRRPTESENIQ